MNHKYKLTITTLLLIFALFSVTAPIFAAVPTFTNISGTANLGTSPGGGGIGFLDCNNDGYMDVVMNSSDNSSTNKLLRQNDGDNTFTDRDSQITVDGRGLTVGDFDNDGDVDMFIGIDQHLQTNTTSGADCTFSHTDMADKNVEAVAFADIDEDGYLDIFEPAASGHMYWGNDGDSTWTSYNAMPGASADDADEGGSVADMNNDGYLDYIMDDGSTNSDVYLNDGDGTYTLESDVNGDSGAGDISGLPENVGTHENMEWAWGDCDYDDDLDVYISGTTGEGLYQNDGDGDFTDITSSAGISMTDPDGADWGDVDNDGDLDLLLAQEGGVSKLYENDGTCGFTDAASTAGINGSGDLGKTVGFFDSDNDGDLDILVNNAAKLWRNNQDDTNYLTIIPEGLGTSNKAPVYPIGAKIIVYDAGTSDIVGVQHVHTSYNQLQPPLWRHFGLTGGSSYDVEVTFPNSGTTLKYTSCTPTSESYTIGSTTLDNTIHMVEPSTNTTESCPNASADIDISGTVYLANGSTQATTGNGGQCDGSTANLSLRVNGGAENTTTCSNTDGSYTFSTITANSGDTLTIYSTDSTDKSNRVLVAGTSNLTGINLVKDDLIISDESDGTVTNADLEDYDNDDNATDMLFTSNTNALTVETGIDLVVIAGDTHDPGGAVTTPNLVVNGSFTQDAALDVNGTFDLGASATFTQGANNDINIFGNVTIADGATFTKATGTGKLILDGDLTFTDNSSGTKQDMGAVEIGTSPDTTDLASDFAATSLTVNGGDIFNTNGYEVDIGTGGITINATGTFDATDDVETDTTQITVEGSFTNSGTFVESDSTLTFDGSTAATFDSGCATAGSCTSQELYNVTINKASSSDTVTLSTNHLTVTNTLTITQGTFTQGNLNIQAEGTSAISVGANGTWTNTGTGNIALDGSVSNAGTVTLQSGGTCGGNDDIAITAVSGTPSWSGAGIFSLQDVSVTSQNATANITVKSGTDGGSNTGNWTFEALCSDSTSTAGSASFGTYDNLTDGLVGWWKMDETASPSIDSSGNGNSGTWVGGANDAVGKFGNGITLQTVDSDYIDLGDLALFDFATTDFTISAWFKTNTSASNFNTIISKSSSSSSGQSGWMIYMHTDETIHLKIDDGTRVKSVTTSTYNDGAWHQVVGVWDRDSNQSLYIDGQLIDSDDISYVGDITNTDEVRIGADGGTVTYGWEDELDEVRIYNRALSPAEVRQLYKWAPGPVAYYSFDEGTGTSTVYDRSGSGNDGTMNGSMTESDWVPGKFGSALEFDGGDDNISVENGLINNYPFTLSAWFTVDSFSSGQFLIAVGDSGSNYPFYGMGTGLGGNNDKLAIVMRGSEGSEDNFSHGGGLISGQWYHGSAVYVSDTERHLYLNGKLIGSDTGQQGFGSVNQFRIAEKPTTQEGGNWPGKVDEVKIYNYARTQEQIIEDMNGGHPVGGSPVGSQVGYWKFDEGYGDTAFDSSPQGNDGDLAGTCPGDANCPTWSNDGKFGKALSFDGINDYITTADIDYGSGNQITISAWVKYSSCGGDNNSCYIIMKHRYTGSSPYSLYVKDNGLAFNVKGTEIITTSTYNDNEWHYVAGILSGDVVDIYVDGNHKKTATGASPTNNDELVTIGSDDDNPTYREFNGLIDEVKIYNVALTPEQIKMEYNRGKTAVLGSTHQDSNGVDNSADKAFLPPGDTGSNCGGSGCAPVGWWKFDEGTGTGTDAVKDSSGNENHGTMEASMTASDWVPSPHNWAMEFDGNSSQHVDLGNQLSFSGNDPITVEGWVKWNSLDGGRIINGGSHEIVLFDSSDNATFVLNSFTTNDRASGSTTLTTGSWYHIAGTYDGTDIKVYVNGAEDGTTTPTGTYGTANSTWRIGNSSTNHYLTGLIDDVRIYDYARTPAQIAWDYNRGAPIGWWKLDECQGTTAYDASGNGNNGTITIGATGTNTSAGTCSSGTGTEAWNNGTTGKRGASLDFDGTDDYVSLGDNDLFSFGDDTDDQPFSVAAWINFADATGNKILTKMDETTGSTQIEWEIYTSGDDSLRFRLYDDSTGARIGRHAGDMTAYEGQWVHVVGTYSGNESGSGMDIYVNAKIADTGDSSSGSYTAMENTSSPVLIGAYEDNSGAMANLLDGQIDEVKIWNYALTDEQVKLEYNAGAVRFE